MNQKSIRHTFLFDDFNVGEDRAPTVKPTAINKQDNVVKSVNSNQHAILRDIMVLHNDGEPFDCDMTFSKGVFYGQHGDVYIPEPKHKCDVAPLRDDIMKIEPDGLLPFDNDELNSIVVDLPFVISTGPSLEVIKKGVNITAARFGTYSSADELYKSYAHWLTESYRVLRENGLCVFKTQATVSGQINYNTPEFACVYAQKLGFVVDDEFILVAKSRVISGKVKRQMHARKYHSSFLVLKKWNTKKYKRCNIAEIADAIFEENATCAENARVQV